ncbi:hypothetical protein J2Y73_003228 [Peribacillus frigoritolerans]|nr:hypothetical protein [Peribacillus frigoritolerans]
MSGITGKPNRNYYARTLFVMGDEKDRKVQPKKLERK